MKIDTCRLCKAGKLSEPVLDFGETPLANEFLPTIQKQDMFPLQVCKCLKCGHYQLNESIDPERIFNEHYPFVAGTSKVNVEYFKSYAEEVIKYFDLKPGARILDIASNDGVLLRHFKDMGMSVLGIDPAKSIADEATKKGIPTIPEFFTSEFADKMLLEHGQFDLITANNVFAHVPDLEDFAKGVKKLLKNQGVFAFEVSYFGDVVSKTLFDTIYHEHSSYHTLWPLFEFFKSLDMDLWDVKEISNHGGSFRAYVRRNEDVGVYPGRWSSSRMYCMEGGRIWHLSEREQDLDKKLNDLQREIKYLGLELREQIRLIKNQNKSIVIYGTPAKATTLMYALGIDEKLIDFAVEDNPLKQGKFTPGKHIPIYPPASIVSREAADPTGARYTNLPDYILILAWNFADSIMGKCKQMGYRGKFIVPLPEFKVI